MLNKRTATKIGVLIGVTALVVPQLAMAAVTFDQLTDDMFVVSHRVKFLGSRGQAMRMVYEKAASLCVAAGYTHFEIADQESQAWQEEEAANASVRVRFFFEGGGNRIECRRNASDEYIQQTTLKLAQRGYRYPERPTVAAGAPAATGPCLAEQVSAMRNLGLSSEQIEAACSN